MRYRTAMSRIVLAALALVAVSVAPASAARPHCGSWTRFGHLGNQTGQAIVMWDRDGAVPRQVVPADGDVPFRETLPWSVRKHEDVVYMKGADWSSDQEFWLVRPDRCSL